MPLPFLSTRRHGYLLLASITISSYPVYIFFSFSVQAEKREQAKKDLKGLEETVVCISMPGIVCCQYHSLAARASVWFQLNFEHLDADISMFHNSVDNGNSGRFVKQCP